MCMVYVHGVCAWCMCMVYVHGVCAWCMCMNGRPYCKSIM